MAGVSRIRIRLRVAAASAIAMTVVLAASGWYVYTSLGQLSHALNRELRVRADDLAAVVSDPDSGLAESNGPFVERSRPETGTCSTCASGARTPSQRREPPQPGAEARAAGR
jgi:hypothetical protein